MSNSVLEKIHQVLRNLVRTFNISQTYVDINYPWTGILATSAFTMFSTTNIFKVYITSQLFFGPDIILPIEHELD